MTERKLPYKPPAIRHTPKPNDALPAQNIGYDAERIEKGILDLIDSGRLRGGALLQAGKVLTHLAAPVRLVLVGNSDRFKRRLLTELLGADPLPEIIAQPILIAAPMAQRAVGAPASRVKNAENLFHFAVLSMDSPALAVMSVLALPIQRNREKRRAALIWVADHCDICIWDCARFDSDEATLWRDAPSTLRSNAYLAAPQLGGVPPGFLARFDPDHALATLADAVLERAGQGRQARLDQAAAFLALHTKTSEKPAKPVRFRITLPPNRNKS